MNIIKWLLSFVQPKPQKPQTITEIVASLTTAETINLLRQLNDEARHAHIEDKYGEAFTLYLKLFQVEEAFQLQQIELLNKHLTRRVIKIHKNEMQH